MTKAPCAGEDMRRVCVPPPQTPTDLKIPRSGLDEAEGEVTRRETTRKDDDVVSEEAGDTLHDGHQLPHLPASLPDPACQDTEQLPIQCLPAHLEIKDLLGEGPEEPLVHVPSGLLEPLGPNHVLSSHDGPPGNLHKPSPMKSEQGLGRRACAYLHDWEEAVSKRRLDELVPYQVAPLMDNGRHLRLVEIL